MAEFQRIKATLELVLCEIANSDPTTEWEFTPEQLKEICTTANHDLLQSIGDSICPIEDDFSKTRLQQIKTAYPNIYGLRFYLGEQMTIVVNRKLASGSPRREYFERDLTRYEALLYRAAISNALDIFALRHQIRQDRTIRFSNLKTIASLLRGGKNTPAEEITKGPGA